MQCGLCTGSEIPYQDHRLCRLALYSAHLGIGNGHQGSQFQATLTIYVFLSARHLAYSRLIKQHIQTQVSYVALLTTLFRSYDAGRRAT